MYKRQGYQFKHFLINGEKKVPANLKSPSIFETANSDMTIAAVIEKVQPVSYTHLDVYKRQASAWRT